MDKHQPVKFIPVPMERIWGGHKLKTLFHETASTLIGEYWVLSGHPNGLSVVADGPYQGLTLVELTERYPAYYLGHSPQPRFPLLIKFLEAAADLSVQIHPDDDYAKTHEGDYGKTEAWYVLDAEPGARINYGHSFTDPQTYIRAVRNGRVPDYLDYLPVTSGQFVFVPSRTLHALLRGTVVIEIQQTSDVTYRVYDWDRIGDDGKPRALHVEKAADALTYGVTPAERAKQIGADLDVLDLQENANGTVRRLVSSPYFTIDKVSVEANLGLDLSAGRTGNPDILVVATGKGRIEWEGGSLDVTEGDTVLIPTNVKEYKLQSMSGLTALRTFY